MNEVIIQAYVNAVRKGKITIEQVDETYKEAVQTALNESN